MKDLFCLDIIMMWGIKKLVSMETTLTYLWHSLRRAWSLSEVCVPLPINKITNIYSSWNNTCELRFSFNTFKLEQILTWFNSKQCMFYVLSPPCFSILSFLKDYYCKHLMHAQDWKLEDQNLDSKLWMALPKVRYLYIGNCFSILSVFMCERCYALVSKCVGESRDYIHITDLIYM